jgi:hypothetical protein
VKGGSLADGDKSTCRDIWFRQLSTVPQLSEVIQRA